MNILKNLIYIYQAEQYNKRRFLIFVYKNLNWLGLSKRGKLDWTLRAKLIFVIVIIFKLLILCTVIWVVLHFNILYALPIMLLFLTLLPFFVLFADALIAPAAEYKKKKILNLAKNIINDLKSNGLIIIGVTGSYGKTGTKDAVATVLGTAKEVYKTTGNINTDIGIAQLIIKDKDSLMKSDVFVVEMSAYKIGEIESTCNIVQPDYSITTAIAPVHIERFGSIENIIKAKFELANNTHKLAILNICNKIIKDKYKELLQNTSRLLPVCADNIKIAYRDNFTGITFMYDNHGYNTDMIAPYTVELLLPVIKLAKEIGLSGEDIFSGVSKTKQAKHRLEVIRNKELNRTIIDDSYNGNYDGFLAGIDVLSRANGRKLVLTPGIVELGSATEEIHKKLAQKYIDTLDFVLLIKSVGTEHIKERFDNIGFNKYRMYDTAEDAHDDLKNVLQSGDTILFQNDLTDNYN